MKSNNCDPIIHYVLKAPHIFFFQKPTKEAFITEVFDQQQGTHKFCGFVDCDSPKQFDDELL